MRLELSRDSDTLLGERPLQPTLVGLTVEELPHGKKVDMPPGYGTFKQAEKAEQQAQQHELGL